MMLIALLALSLGQIAPLDSARYLPPGFEERLTFYESFDGAAANPGALTEEVAPLASAAGWAGAGAEVGGTAQKAAQWSSPALSPHLPLTIAFWWRLPDGCAPNAWFSWVHLFGRGYIGAFGRGGPWCGLTDTAGVLQIWDVPGVPGINDIWDRQLRQRLALDQAAWHHLALTVAGGSRVSLYLDGALAATDTLTSRAFGEADGLHRLVMGNDDSPRLLYDELLVLRRALSAAEVADYVRGMVALRALDQAHAP